MKFVSGRLAQITLALIFIVISNVSAAAAEPSESPFVDGAQFVQKLQSEYSAWNDYSCITELHNYKPNKTTITNSRFFYKRGPRVRIEIMGGGFRDGSVIIRNHEDKIAGRGGIWMGGIHMKFEPDSRSLILPDGTNATRADFPELFSLMKENLSRGYFCKVTPAPIENHELARKVFVLELYDPDKVLSARVYLSADEQLPIRWDSFQFDKLRATTWFRKLRVNHGLTDNLFKL